MQEKFEETMETVLLVTEFVNQAQVSPKRQAIQTTIPTIDGIMIEINLSLFSASACLGI